jgi:NAD(P)-dependent dehydrogenase (short-subunit alcohol dehydrogenase family)|tara:strand:+ start:5304 stop:6017 length:714 start_codon:yes stop_codon:yes gene_type:complete
VLVVGASSGLGTALAKAVVATGGQAAVSARRSDRLDELVAEMGGGHALPGDATDPGDARRVAEAAAEAMGGLDLMVYVAGYGVLQPLVETDPDTWTDVFRVNVVGANLAAAATLDHLSPDGIAAFVSSRTVDDANPLFATYSITKAALDQSIRVWRNDHPDRRFVRIVMGNTAPTEFADHMRPERLGEALETWQGLGIPGGTMDVDDVGRALAESLAVALDHPGIDSSEIRFDARPD